MIVANDPIAGRTQLVQQPSGAIQLYFPNAAGVGRMTSTDDGASWTGPIQTLSHTVGGVMGAAVLPDGTPLFSQDGTGFVNVFRGLNGETVRTSIRTAAATRSRSRSIQPGSSRPRSTRTRTRTAPSSTSRSAPTSRRRVDRAEADRSARRSRRALVSDQAGNTFMAWPPGYPTATAFTVVPFRGGQPAGDGVSFRASFGGGDPHMALSVDAQDRLWAAWTGQGAVHVARSRTHGMDFGATVSLAVPGTAYQISAVGIPGTTGKIDVIVNTGSSLIEQQLLPGLSVRVFKTTKKVGKKKIVSWFAQVLDDGFGVTTATVSAGGHTVHVNASGAAALKGLPSAQRRLQRRAIPAPLSRSRSWLR